MLLSTFLADNVDKWFYNAHVYISRLKKVDNIVFRALIRKLIPTIKDQDIPIFRTVEEFIVYWVDNEGLFNYSSGILNTQISKETILKWVQQKNWSC